MIPFWSSSPSRQFSRGLSEHLLCSSTIRKKLGCPRAGGDQQDNDNERPKKKKRTFPHPPPDIKTTMALHLPTIPDADKCYRCRMRGCNSNRAHFQRTHYL
ncbi:hypothetical protein J6590_035539 [Homalodisca vitripennis]|nr:hypothetical protein J6590_035539 [Homalodisca vitripennis]